MPGPSRSHAPFAQISTTPSFFDVWWPALAAGTTSSSASAMTTAFITLSEQDAQHALDQHLYDYIGHLIHLVPEVLLTIF
jgi:hypothetical protein